MSPLFGSLATVPQWHEQAACVGEEPDLFFSGHDREAIVAAQEVCAACPVLVSCREYGVTAREPDGIWGGLTPEQRRRLYRRAAAAGVTPVQMLTMPARAPARERDPSVTPTADIVARYEAGESISEIADAIGRNSGTVYRRLIDAGVQMRSRDPYRRRRAELEASP